MNGIEFETEKYKPLSSTQEVPQKSWAIKVIMKLSGGRIKNDQQASYILVVIAVIFIILSIYNFISAMRKENSPRQEVIKIENIMDEQFRKSKQE